MPADKLDVVDQQNVYIAVFVVKIRHVFVGDGFNKLVGKFFAFYI